MNREHASHRLTLAHHRVVSRALRRKPRLLDEAREVVQAWRSGCSACPWFVGEWANLLGERPETISNEIVRHGPEAIRLRSASPFAMTASRVLTRDQVQRLWRMAAGHATRILGAHEYGLYADHLKRLSATDRERRFWAARDDAWIDRFVGGIDRSSAIIGHFDAAARLDGAIHVGLIDRDGRRIAEMGVSVLPEARHRGIGYHLLERAILWSRNHHANEFYSLCMTGNRDMVRLARQHEMHISVLDDGAEAVVSIAPFTPESVVLELIENQIGQWDYQTKAHDTAFSFALGHRFKARNREMELERLAKMATFGEAEVLTTYLIAYRYSMIQSDVKPREQKRAIAWLRANLEPHLALKPDLLVYINGLPTLAEVRKLKDGSFGEDCLETV